MGKLKINFSSIFRKFWDFEFTHFCGSDGDFWTKCARIDSKKWSDTLLSHLTQSSTKIYVYEILISTIDKRFQAEENPKRDPPQPKCLHERVVGDFGWEPLTHKTTRHSCHPDYLCCCVSLLWFMHEKISIFKIRKTFDNSRKMSPLQRI